MKLSAPIYRLKRQARLLARDAGIPLHDALDRLARRGGFNGWSHLAARMSDRRPARDLLARLRSGDLVLLAARPGHGKTVFGLELLGEAAKDGRHGFFFTLEFNEAETLGHLDSIDGASRFVGNGLTIDTSDDICAKHIIERMRDAPAESIAVVDYLQLLDQKRRHPELADQMANLKAFAAASGVIVMLISQIDRSFDGAGKALPELSDVRLPNPVDLSQFTQTCFPHDGDIRLDATAGG